MHFFILTNHDIIFCMRKCCQFGSKPSRDNLAVLNGSARAGRSPNSASFKEFLLGRSKVQLNSEITMSKWIYEKIMRFLYEKI